MMSTSRSSSRGLGPAMAMDPLQPARRNQLSDVAAAGTEHRKGNLPPGPTRYFKL